MLRSLWFLTHGSLVYIVPSLWVISSRVLPFYLMIILSWQMNDDNCIISELEYNLFGENFKGTGPNCRVPSKQRYIMYGSTLLCIVSITYNNFSGVVGYFADKLL